MQKTRLRLNLILIILFFALAAFQQVYRIGYEWVKIWDESSGAQNAIEMMANKKYFVVHADGKPDHLDVKPPLALWLKIISRYSGCGCHLHNAIKDSSLVNEK